MWSRLDIEQVEAENTRVFLIFSVIYITLIWQILLIDTMTLIASYHYDKLGTRVVRTYFHMNTFTYHPIWNVATLEKL